MGSLNRSIKRIKRNDREVVTVDDEVCLPKTENQVTREMVQTVASWIIERRESTDELNRRARELIVVTTK
jgi:hypothetical protein